ncbi:hypothetical protein SERLADRAFT_481065 [Serpula lacrymans var. lacrymans S7.9]|uniref:Uncharacterized protein n=1 Tax=Serpula lacrymans var. lacrymans (strain S7.9) TaxID=578457 RepID=F8PEG9_SERL9|nr:uncharacterized protein SERLADRAFT_481065 [Serpula lacrymans var. lacrymans S7.9]EGO18501.1 hypothetical protein SERLADRAFT_481065 [Serpula lacrymans var. lacrymans S7.9]
MQRRIFSKVTSANKEKSSILRKCDDPMERAKSVFDKWQILEKLPLGRVDALHTQFRKGDFVDVGVSIDISIFCGNCTKQLVQAHPKLEHILQVTLISQLQSLGVVSEKNQSRVLILPRTLPGHQ